MGVTAFILAGGKSTRMGRDKAFVLWEGRTLLDRALEVAGGVASKVCVVGPRETLEGYAEVVVDVYPGRGPLAGIHAALTATPSEINVVLAVDLPFVTKALLMYLVDRYVKETKRDTTLLAVVPHPAAGWEPLCAVYRKAFAAVADQALRQGHNAIHPLLEQAGVLSVTEKELGEAGFSAQMFRNINTIMDLEANSACRKT